MIRGAWVFAPGVPQLLRGRLLAGGTALLLWLGLLALTAMRHDRVLSSLSGGPDDWIALLTLVGSLLGAWIWSAREERRSRAAEGPREGVGPWTGFWEIFSRNHLALAGLWVILAFYLAALLSPFLAPFDPAYQPAFQGGERGLVMAPPSWLHVMGTDQLSRDILSRILYGSRISLTIGLLAVAISVTVGTLLGAVAGYLGGWVDGVVTRCVDLVMAFPRLVLLIVLAAFFDSSLFLIVMALALTQWPLTTRVVRGEILSLREREFSEAARALGFSGPRIVLRHLLPNALGPIIVTAALGIGNAIVLEAGLSFLGLGVQPPTPSWGVMVATGRSYLSEAWWIATFPGLAIVLVVLAFNLVGDGFRDAFDPRQARGKGA